MSFSQFSAVRDTQVLARPHRAGLWPVTPVDVGRGESCPSIAPAQVFPSARAAIAQSLEAAKLPPNTWIAVPDWTSDCLRRTVSPFGTPMSIAAVGREHDVSVGAAVVYEQWGWPVTADGWREIAARFAGCWLVVDRVDSGDFLLRSALQPDLPEASVEVVSLSKLLGLAGGGLARTRCANVEFDPKSTSSAVRRLLERPRSLVERGAYSDLFKISRCAVHPTVMTWLRLNCLTAAVERERLTRQRHLLALVETELSRGWPTWMIDALDQGAGPVWAPILRGQDQARRWSAMRTLEQRYGVSCALPMFNWAGNPLRPHYEPCLAVPVHGGVQRFDELVHALTEG